MSQIAKAKTAKLSKLTISIIPLDSSPSDSLQSPNIVDQTEGSSLIKIVRTLIDYFPPSARDLQKQVLDDNIEWAKQEKRVFLRQSLDIKLVGL